jgi:uncharacterized protein YndB with AHSA1/START domain
MAPIVASIEISRSPEDVFACVTDPSHLPEWQGGVVRAERIGEGPVVVGTRAVVTRRMGRRELNMTVEIAELDLHEASLLAALTTQSEEKTEAPSSRSTTVAGRASRTSTTFGVTGSEGCSSRSSRRGRHNGGHRGTWTN